jgi:hypothetical protein
MEPIYIPIVVHVIVDVEQSKPGEPKFIVEEKPAPPAPPTIRKTRGKYRKSKKGSHGLKTMSKFTEEEKDEMIRMWNEGASGREIAEKFKTWAPSLMVFMSRMVKKGKANPKQAHFSGSLPLITDM